MKDATGTEDPLSWRRHQPARPAGPPQLVSMPKAEAKAIPRTRIEPAWKAKDNWRTHAAPLSQQEQHQHQQQSQQQHQPHHQQQQHTNQHQVHFSHDARDAPAAATSASRLSTSLGSTGSTHLAVPSAASARATNNSNPWANGVGVIGSGRPNSSLKPSSIASNGAGRTADLGTSPPQYSRSPPMHSDKWSLTQPTPGPATKLRALQIGGGIGGRLQPLDGQRVHPTPVNRALTEKERNENWMLTPTSSLPSLPGTPSKPRDSSIDSASNVAQANAERTQAVDANALHRRREHESRVYGSNAQTTSRVGGLSSAFSASQQQSLPRTPVVNSASTFASGASPATSGSLLSRGLGGPIHSSPKRSPLVVSGRSGARGNVYAAPGHAYGPGAGQPAAATSAWSPGASPKLLDRTLAPIARLPIIETASQQAYNDSPSHHVSTSVAGLSSLRSPGALTRRDSVASAASSVQGGYSLSRSRRSSQVISPTSPPGTSKRVGVYRPPHLRNRGSVSGLRPSVAHYDRVRTPNLRGHSRSRESSVSLSRGGSRPPSSLAFYRADTIPEHGTPDPSRFPHHRERLQSMTSVAGSIREREDSLGSEDRRSYLAHGERFVAPDARTNDPSDDPVQAAKLALDGASLVAKLEEQSRIDDERIRLSRRNRFDRSSDDVFAETRSRLDNRPFNDLDGDKSGANDDSHGKRQHGDDIDAIDDDNDVDEDDDNASQEFFDLSADDLMHYGASDGYPLSRNGSAIEGRPPGDIFEVGDRLGPGLEHEGQMIRIAETTPGFVDQNGDLTGSQLEVVRKLGEGSYAVVYLVREVMPEDPQLTDADGAFSIADDEDAEMQPAAARAAFITGSRQGRRSGSMPQSPDPHPSYAAARALIHNEDEADETMRGQDSEDLLSSTLKAHVDAGDTTMSYHSPSLEQRRRKDLQDEQHQMQQQQQQQQPRTTPFTPREFALKCLCKRDLPEDMLEIQRLEATIHQSIPAHPNIVTLYRTYETQDWLFLILEYCPGQDLYYWLEQAQDTDAAVAADGPGRVNGEDDASARRYQRDSVSPRPGADGDDMSVGELGTSLDATPPSPSLLASTAGSTLLSRRRVRLISRMFRQICDAVQFCHDRGISHRDIKPENFIVEDRRYTEEAAAASPFAPDQSVSTVADSMRDTEARVIVKMTDFGLATADERCDDFDCGSKPYMAFECHNNVSCDYDPKQADVWSLGVVLLNLLFHRNPFTEPSSDCPSFSAYCYDPVGFLMDSFDGLTEKVACYLAENVFCSVDVETGARKRVSAGELSRWALGLVEHLDLNGPGPGRISRGASMYATTPLIHSRTTSISTLPSMLGSPKGRSRSIAREGSIDLQGLNDFNTDGLYRSSFFGGLRDSISPGPGLFTPDVLPSPRFTPSPRPAERNPFDAQYGRASPLPPAQSPEQQSEPVKGSALRQEVVLDQHSSPRTTVDSDYQERLDRDEVDAMLQCESKAPGTSAEEDLRPSSSHRKSLVLDAGSLPAIIDVEDDVEEMSDKHSATAAEAPAEKSVPAEQSDDISNDNGIGNSSDHETDPDGDDESAAVAPGEAGEGDCGDDPSEPSTEATTAKPASITASNHSKRRKRGARKGRTLAKQLKRSQSVENLSRVTDIDVEAQARDATIRELALASETLARQMSKMSGKQADAEDARSAAVPSVSLSPPTAAAAAKFNLQVLSPVQRADLGAADAAANTATSLVNGRASTDRASLAETASTVSSNWSSAAQRRERINERKAGAAPTLQDSGRSKPMSWRERNPSTTTFSSLASNSTVSSRSSVSSESSSVYSTASAPAALTKRDPSLRSRSRASGLLSVTGLGTISEREKPQRKEVDASYLAGIFGGDEARAMDKKRREAREKAKAEAERERGKGKLLELLQDTKSKDSVGDKDKAARKDTGLSRQSTHDSQASAAASPSPSTSFVSRFRRPGSSSSAKSKDSAFKAIDASGASNASSSPSKPASMSPPVPVTGSIGGGLGLRRDAATSASSLQTALEPREVGAGATRSASLRRSGDKNQLNGDSNVAPMSEAAPHRGGSLRSPSQASFVSLAGKSTASHLAPLSSPSASSSHVPEAGCSDAAAPTTAPAPVAKKRGMGKFFSGMRDTLMNR
ncbi:uncharacterized protein PFL1_03646 [Pseudozyma flocculosa PF-1]|uniref:Protein kinase domain-containing protein n=2 Tax=Pseudozyma flocculosa TaxID=84751 RepID=A0A5C3F5V0_9BASI|nr:uncharacterized protein PFL1_03646 [Pseudozyma flocculosa PF-1]EPQ28843.1 hypothetical protein PFL1_03646 [Pseudozyma flocculosa PF-1]SPO39366.1 uncharacterized protein PSFLO_04847 [Pseudozyma flocculosa]